MRQSSDAFGCLVSCELEEFLQRSTVRSPKFSTTTMGVGMNQVERRQREQLLAEELALLRSCGGEIRRTDREALALARIRGVGNLTSVERICKAVRTLSKSIVRRTRGLIKADVPHGRRRLGL